MIDWEAVQVLDRPLPPPDSPIDVDGSRYEPVPENGFTMFVAALAGPVNLVRIPGVRRVSTVIVTEIRGSITTRRVEDRTPSDDEVIDEDIEIYLDDADLARPPRGYTWFLRVPADCGTIDDVFGSVNERLRGSTAVYPRDTRRDVEPVVRGLYDDPSPAGAAG